MHISVLCISLMYIVCVVQLPLYKNERVLREKLLQAINSNAGFDLS